MAYQDIKQQVAFAFNRNDLTDAQLADAINRGKRLIERRVRVSCMVRYYVTVVGQGFTYLAIPNDHLETKEITWSRQNPNGDVVLSTILASAGNTYGKILELRRQARVPEYYAQIGTDRWLLAGNPAPGDEIAVAYYASFPDLVNDADTSALTEMLGDALVYAACAFLAEDFKSEDLESYQAAYQQMESDLNSLENKEQFRGLQSVQVPYWGY